jgi:hypothetical protein
MEKTYLRGLKPNLFQPAFAWRIPGLKRETWGTHHLTQDVLTQTLKPSSNPAEFGTAEAVPFVRFLFIHS